MQALFLLWLVIENHDNLFIMAEFVHFVGIGLLTWKLLRKKNAGGGCLNTLIYSEAQPGAGPLESITADEPAAEPRAHCAGLSLRTQELTAIFLAIRLYCRQGFLFPSP